MQQINSINPMASAAQELTLNSGEAQAKEKFCKDFEGLFIKRLLDEMKNTVGQWGGQSDSSSEQIQGIFMMNLAQEMGDKGGLGLWKQIYQQLDTHEPQSQSDTNIQVQI